MIFRLPTTDYRLLATVARRRLSSISSAVLNSWTATANHAPQTVEQQAREFNAALTHVLGAVEVHAEAIEAVHTEALEIIATADNLRAPKSTYRDGKARTNTLNPLKASYFLGF